eukprot:TRINITY_DN28330_c0_g1_i1.p1 TRINITY_DN28330_c0_g1~~TRINITY_DN28330_c0_g1_i1.p1  ORF type:complete len:827 (-),score=86.21 TRINITY_DN28330_c0_g1_i1:166-2646(-)
MSFDSLSFMVMLVGALVCNYLLRTMYVWWRSGWTLMEVCKGFLLGSSISQFETRVKEMMSDMRVRRVIIMVNVCQPMMVIGAALRLASCGLRTDLKRWGHDNLLVVTLFRQAVALVFFEIFPLLTQRVAEYGMVATSWFVCVVQLIFCFTLDTDEFAMNLPIVVLVRCVTAVFLSGVHHTVAQQFILSAAYVYAQCTFPLHPLSTSSNFFVLREGVISCCIIAMTWVFHKSLDAEARATLYQKAASDGKATGESLLSVMCDAVIHLNADLIISQPAPKLATILSSPISKFEGRAILDMMTSADAQRFKSVCHRALRDKHAKTLNVSLHDSRSVHVDTQLFVASCKDVDDQPGYVVGFEELEHIEHETSTKPMNTPVGFEAIAMDYCVPKIPTPLSSDDTHSVSCGFLDEELPSEASTAGTVEHSSDTHQVPSECRVDCKAENIDRSYIEAECSNALAVVADLNQNISFEPDSSPAGSEESVIMNAMCDDRWYSSGSGNLEHQNNSVYLSLSQQVLDELDLGRECFLESDTSDTRFDMRSTTCAKAHRLHSMVHSSRVELQDVNGIVRDVPATLIRSASGEIPYELDEGFEGILEESSLSTNLDSYELLGREVSETSHTSCFGNISYETSCESHSYHSTDNSKPLSMASAEVSEQAWTHRDAPIASVGRELNWDDSAGASYTSSVAIGSECGKGDDFSETTFDAQTVESRRNGKRDHQCDALTLPLWSLPKSMADEFERGRERFVDMSPVDEFDNFLAALGSESNEATPIFGTSRSCVAFKEDLISTSMDPREDCKDPCDFWNVPCWSLPTEASDALDQGRDCFHEE